MHKEILFCMIAIEITIICMECPNATDMHVGCFSTGWTGGSWMAAHCDWIWN